MRSVPRQGLIRFPVDAHLVEAKPQKRRNHERFRDLQHKFT
jgi:hypothetical protein